MPKSYRLLPKKTQLRADTLQFSSQLPPKRVLSTMSTKTWNSLARSTTTQRASNSSLRMQVWASEKSDNSMSPCRVLATFTPLPSGLLKSLLRTRDSSTSSRSQRSTLSSTSNSIKRRRSQSSQHTSWAQQRNKKSWVLCKQIPWMQANNSRLNSK
jgi:hypothetical protein